MPGARVLLGALGLPVLVLLLFMLAWGFDSRSHDGRVARNVTLLDEELGGLTPDAARTSIDALGTRVLDMPVLIEIGEPPLQSTAGDLGLRLDTERTLQTVLAARQGGVSVLAPFRWGFSLFDSVAAPIHLQMDPDVAVDAALQLASVTDTPAGPPSLVLAESGRLEAVEGAPGQRLDTNQLVRRLQTVQPQSGDATILIGNVLDSVPSTVGGAELTSVVDQLNAKTILPLEVTVDGAKRSFSPGEVRSWLRLVTRDDGSVTPGIVAERVQPAIEEAFADVATDPDFEQLAVVDGRLTLGEGTPGLCCEPAGRPVLTAVVDGQPAVELQSVPGPDDYIARLGFGDLVGEFTTEHPPDQPRVTNIQRMADIVRGATIEPGATFSLNDHVGRRTIANGFVEDTVIYDGVLTTDVGGGVSQFATTIFNAAFFAGLDFGEYQAHSIHFDRYPRGREATVSFPAPDLEIVNTTEHPVLIWTEYTDTSITVQLFSTRHIIVQETNSTDSVAGFCTRVTTERTRRYPNDEIKVDTVEALYQPAEGIGCDGASTWPEPECADDEQAWDSDGDGRNDACRIFDPNDPDDLCPDNSVPSDTDGDGVPDVCVTT